MKAVGSVKYFYLTKTCDTNAMVERDKQGETGQESGQETSFVPQLGFGMYNEGTGEALHIRQVK